MFGGNRVLQSWILCAVFVTVAFSSLATPACAFSGSVFFMNASGEYVDSYTVPTTMYIRLVGSGGDNYGSYFQYLLRDATGTFVDTADYPVVDLLTTETYALTIDAPTGTWTAALRFWDDSSLRWYSLDSDSVTVSSVALPNVWASDIYTTPDPPLGGQSATITYIMKTNSVPFTQTIYTDLYIDGVKRSTQALAGSTGAATHAYTYTTTLSAGSHEIMMVTDSTGVLSELAESDNDRTETISWAFPNVWVSDIYTVPNPPIGGQDATIYYVVNTNNVPFTTDISTDFYVDGFRMHTDFLGGSTGATTHTYTYGPTALAAGAHELKVITDATSALTESDEMDNQLIETITWQTAPYYGVPTLSLPLDGASGVSVCPTFVWDPPDDSDMSKIEVLTASTSETHYTTSNYYLCALEYETAYSWHVAASPDSGITFGPWSVTWAFTTEDEPVSVVPVVTPSKPGYFTDTSGGTQDFDDEFLSSGFAQHYTSSNSVQVGTASGAVCVPTLIIPLDVSIDSEAVAWAKVWKTIEIGKSARYSVLASGDFSVWTDTFAVGGGYAETHIVFYFDIVNVITGEYLIHQVLADHLDKCWPVIIPDPPNFYGEAWEVLVQFDGIKGNWYNIGVSAEARSMTTTVFYGGGTAFVDAASDSDWRWHDSEPAATGLRMDHFTVFTPSIGCVAEGTMVTMADGSTKPVEDIVKGDAVLGYDPETGAYMTQIVKDLMKARVEVVLYINGGDLITTLTHQPIFVRNGTWAGWVTDPQDLKVGCEIFRPIDGEWTVVTELEVRFETMRVYDFTTDGYMTYLGNGYLLMDKAIPVH